jgi:ribonuclease T2
MRLGGWAAVALCCVPAPALAQAFQCSLPSRIGPLPPPKPDGPARRTPVAGYTLAVSWSPEFCRGGSRDSPIQCSGANGRFGFVLHGLWPEARRGASPQWCSITPRPSPELIRRNVCMTPVPWLLEHEWAKHGSCMVRTPESYFRVSGILWRSLRWPDADRLSRREAVTVGDLRKAFVLANRAWKPEQVGVFLSRNGWLREIRLCYGRDFMPAPCPRPRRGAPDSAPLKIWRGL